jgi:hypothetical protein
MWFPCIALFNEDAVVELLLYDDTAADANVVTVDVVGVPNTAIPIERSFDLHRKFSQGHLFVVTFIDDVLDKQLMSCRGCVYVCTVKSYVIW